MKSVVLLCVKFRNSVWTDPRSIDYWHISAKAFAEQIIATGPNKNNFGVEDKDQPFGIVTCYTDYHYTSGSQYVC